VPGFPKKGAN